MKRKTLKILLVALCAVILANNPTAVKAQAPGALDLSYAGGVMKADTFTTAVSPGNNNRIYALAIQSDGKHIIAGDFRTINGTGRNYIARVNADGTLDETFDTGIGFGNLVQSVVAQPDGKILVGGSFSNFTDLSGITTKRYIARLNSNGTLDTAFGVNGGANSAVKIVLLQPDGKILIGGSFTAFDGTARNGIARLNADGSLDLTFDTSVGVSSGGSVNGIVLQPDGKIVVGGDFATFNGAARKNIARLNDDGSIDTAFNPGAGADQPVLSIALQPDGKIVIGGNITSYDGISTKYIARVNANGTKDTFLEGTPCPSPCPSNYPYLNLQSPPTQITATGDGKIYVSADGKRIPANPNDLYESGIFRFNPDGSMDATFARPSYVSNLNPNDGRHAIQANGQILTNFGRKLVSSFEVQSGMKRFNSDGTPDNSYAPVIGTFLSSIHDLHLLPDGKLLAVGEFNTVATTARIGIARFNADGTLDTSYTTRTNGNPFKILRQPDGKIIVTGGFGQVNGATRNSIARLNEDGTLDITFNPQPGTTGGLAIFTAALQPDGKILIGGNFTAYNGVTRRGVARLNPDGSLDTTFDPGNGVAYSDTVRDGVKTIAVQPDGKILIGGKFTTYNNVLKHGIARLNSDGSLDTTFNTPSTNNNVFNAFHLFPDGKVLVGGTFGLNVSPNSRNNIVRLNGDGTLDTTFGTNASSPNGTVSEIHVQSNGKIIIGGLFGTVAGQNRRGIARINGDGSLDSSFGDNMLGANPFGGSSSFWSDLTGLAVDEANGKLYYGAGFSTFNNVGRGSLARLFTGATQNARTPFDYDGDGRADVSVFRPSAGAWFLNRSSQGFTGIQFGIATDRLAPADFDGDGKTDLAVFRDGNWYSLRSSDGAFTAVQFGAAGDVPAPADFDGDGRADPAVFRNGTWYLLRSQAGFTGIQFGASGDVPVAADYDGDGRADVAVYRGGSWFTLRSSDGAFTAVQFGIAGDKPVPADYDGDGRADQAVYRDGVWYLNRSTAGFTGVQFGIASDVPAPADYDGDGRADQAVFRDGAWYLLQTTGGFTGLQFGAAGDKPTPAAFVP